ncbi:MAG TPA: response regulator [Candidatus Binatia bacterium]|jgi:two-component system cell cycle sensor histidine kinase/response regulator CckA|nr:response regulator [Candidatus Binatia bacterium]
MLNPNHRILIVDDNPAIHEDFRKILCPKRQGKSEVQDLKAALFDKTPKTAPTDDFELVSAFQGHQALELTSQSVAEGRPFAMAFLDVRMPPGWDGVETATRLWRVSPHLQIVICTAYSDYSWDDMRARLDQPDSLVILKKPFDNVEVQQLAHALTKKWLLSHQARLKLAELERMVEERTRDLQKANKSLTQSEECFSKAFHESPLPSGIQSLSDQRFVDVNQCLAEIAGCKREEMIGRTPAELFLWEKPHLADEWVESLLRKDTVRDQEASIRTQAGTLHEVLVSCSPLAFATEPHMLLLAQDVAERALLERQLRQAQKMEAIGQLAAGVAHDFNNILTVIQGHAGLMERSLADGKPSSKSLEQISKAAVRAATLIRQLLMFSRKQVMQFRHLDLNETLSNAIKMLERLVGEHVQIDLRPQPSIPAIYADASMLDQIVMNLAVNARDAMPDGGRVSISTSLQTIHRAPTPMDPQRRDGEFVCLTFTDTGAGMDTPILSRIFEPFFTTKPVGKGTGLGLSTVFGIVRAHQGWLVVESQPNQGTTFRLYFPASKEAAERTDPVVDTGLRTGRETVLVAEDEDALREMVVSVLRIQGYTVLEAASGPQALELWQRADRPIDLLLTDMVMPGGIMGNELAEQLLGQSPRLKVIYTSGYSPGMAGSEGSLLKGRNFLPKPYSIGKLAQFVRECLDSASDEEMSFTAHRTVPLPG